MFLSHPPPHWPMGLQGAAPLAVDVLSCGCSRFHASLTVLIFSCVRGHFAAELAKADRAEIGLLPELGTRWEYLHTGRGVAFSELRSETLRWARRKGWNERDVCVAEQKKQHHYSHLERRKNLQKIQKYYCFSQTSGNMRKLGFKTYRQKAISFYSYLNFLEKNKPGVSSNLHQN